MAMLLAGALTGVLASSVGPIRFDHLSLEDGLSQSTVTCIFQDSRGFLWIGTEDGLNRFDGYDFKIYKNDPSNAASLSHDAVWSIDEDAAGNLWIGTSGGGVDVWERADDRFASELSKGLSSRYVRFVHVDEDGAVWIGTRDAGVDRLDPESGAITSYRADGGSGLSDDRVFVIHTDRSGTVWVGTDGGLNRFDRSLQRFVVFTHDPDDPSSLSSGRVRAISEDGTGTLWVGTYDGGLNRFDRDSGTFQRFQENDSDPFSLSHNRVRAILEDNEGRLWIGTSKGLDLLDPGHEGFAHYRNDPADPKSLNDEHVMSLLQDRGGVIWVGTRTGGLSKWNPLAWQFGHRAPSWGAEGLSNDNIMAFLEERPGELWLGTFGGGVNLMDRATGAVTQYRHDPDDPRSLSSDRVTVLRRDRRGVIWVGTLDGGLNRFDPATESFESYRHDGDRPQSIGANGITSILEDRQSRLWIGTYGGGLDRFDEQRGVFVHHRRHSSHPTSHGRDRVTALAEDARGAIWTGTDGDGLNRYDPETGESVRFAHVPDDPGSIGADSVIALHFDNDGTLWVGTRGGGLAELTNATDVSEGATFVNHSERDGLPNEVIYGILPDDEGNLWLSTNKGLSCFDPRSETFLNYDVNDGLQSNEFHFGSYYRSPSGELFFGGLNGFNSFYPDRLKHNNHAPPVVLTSFLKLNQQVPDAGPVPEITAIDLGYDDDVITFEFAALDYSAPRENRYLYKLEGFDKDWMDGRRVRRVTYTNLDPGNYVFRVRGANNDGVWSEDGLSVALTVDTPPWRSAWAYVLYGLVVGGVVLAFVRAQKRKLELELAYSRRLEREVEARTEELAKASITDSLTGLANRRFLLEYLEKEIDQIQRRYHKLTMEGLKAESFDLAFMMVDLDNFKTVNDTCGHTSGDLVLQQLKTILEDACRSSDILIRWGGDELLVVARDSDQTGVEALAERIRSKIEARVFELEEGRVVRMTSSIGFACYPFIHERLNTLSWQQVVSVADRALYVAKRSGRNAWVGFLGTEQTPAPNLLGQLLENPKRLADAGLIKVRTSVNGELVWDSPEPHQIPRLDLGRPEAAEQGKA